MAGFEPTTSRLLSECSTAKLHWLCLGYDRLPRDPSENRSAQSNKQRTTPVGFEPTRAEPTGLAGRRLNHSAKVSWWPTARLPSGDAVDDDAQDKPSINIARQE